MRLTPPLAKLCAVHYQATRLPLGGGYTWLYQVAGTYNILPMDGPIFRLWARLMHRRADDLIEDAMIAATAHAHGLTLVTRNIRDFQAFDVRTLNPFVTSA